MKPGNKILIAVLDDQYLLEKISALAIAGKGSEQELRKRARKYLLEIAADCDERWVKVWDRFLTLLWRVLYNAFIVDQKGLAVIKEISCRMPCVLIPCHRSHVDYLILSHIFYKQKMSLPRIAAGDNMNFWPLGYIFRKAGAFFLRRSFRGDDLYTEVFTAYLKYLLQDGTTMEFFLEGGRSRTGKMLLPRYGFISMIMRSYQDRISDDLALIPVYLGYDRIIEENSYLKELRGVQKKTESAIGLLKSAKIMWHYYGNVYVNIGTPIFLKSYLEEQPRSFADMTAREQQALYRDIGARVVCEINRIAVVTPAALVAASLLCLAGGEVTGALLKTTVSVFYNYLLWRQVNISPSMASEQEAILSVLALFQKWGFIFCKYHEDGNQGQTASYSIPEAKRLNLEYYKNNIVHHFLPVCFVSLAIIARKEEATVALIKEDCLFLKNILKEEFSWEADEVLEVEEVLSYLEGNGFILRVEGRVAFPEKEVMVSLYAFAGLLGSLLDAYRAVFKALSRTEEAQAAGEDLPDNLRRLAGGMHGSGVRPRAESLSREYYKNALNLLQHEGIISNWNKQGNENERDVIRINDEERLAGLRLRLAKFVLNHC